eukprot:6366715-Prymnesium_polylepis.1
MAALPRTRPREVHVESARPLTRPREVHVESARPLTHPRGVHVESARRPCAPLLAPSAALVEDGHLELRAPLVDGCAKLEQAAWVGDLRDEIGDVAALGEEELRRRE